MKHRHIVPAVFAERPNCFPAGVQKMVYITKKPVPMNIRCRLFGLDLFFFQIIFRSAIGWRTDVAGFFFFPVVVFIGGGNFGLDRFFNRCGFGFGFRCGAYRLRFDLFSRLFFRDMTEIGFAFDAGFIRGGPQYSDRQRKHQHDEHCKTGIEFSWNAYKGSLAKKRSRYFSWSATRQSGNASRCLT